MIPCRNNTSKHYGISMCRKFCLMLTSYGICKCNILSHIIVNRNRNYSALFVAHLDLKKPTLHKICFIIQSNPKVKYRPI